jgi:plastocyanin
MLRILMTLLAVLALAVAGCGGDDDENGGGSAATSTPTATPTEASGGGGGGDGGGGETLQLAAPQDGGLVFEPDTLTAKAGKVTIDFDNPSSVPHAVAIDDVDGESDEVTAAKTSLTVDLKPGDYTFYCPVPGHREAGMEGKLTVE